MRLCVLFAIERDMAHGKITAKCFLDRCLYERVNLHSWMRKRRCGCLGGVVMGWEKRKGKLYYYRKERGTDGRVRSIYCGSGARGEQAAREDAQRRTAAQATIMPPLSMTQPVHPPEPISIQLTERPPEASPSTPSPRPIGQHVPLYPPRPSAKPRSRCAIQQWKSLWQGNG